MGNLEEHAERELKLAGLFDEDSDYGGLTGKAVMELIRVFSSQGHSGMSASLVTSFFSKVALFEPLTPLTGEDDEWNRVDYGCEPAYQNKRCSYIFKNSVGGAYNIRGRIFRDKDGCCWSLKGSSVDITFPYLPVTEYVDVDEI